MPLEIKELHIKINVDESSSKGAVSPAGREEQQSCNRGVCRTGNGNTKEPKRKIGYE